MLRLNENTYPSYMALTENNLVKLELDEAFARHYDTEIFKIAVDCQETFNGVNPANIFYITQPFHNALENAADKLVQMLKNGEGEEIGGELYRSAIFIHNNGWAMHRNKREGDNVWFQLFIFSRKALIGYGYIDHNKPHTPPHKWGYVANTLKEYTPASLFASMFNSYNLVLFFIKNCDIETKVLQPKQNTKINGQKYFNEKGRKPVTILDCHWFTELIRNTPFGVRGHLRWQPCGQGRKTRKLIWVDAFEKKGYHRKATKELAENKIP